jgi:hypothetical protein
MAQKHSMNTSLLRPKFLALLHHQPFKGAALGPPKPRAVAPQLPDRQLLSQQLLLQALSQQLLLQALSQQLLLQLLRLRQRVPV